MVYLSRNPEFVLADALAVGLEHFLVWRFGAEYFGGGVGSLGFLYGLLKGLNRVQGLESSRGLNPEKKVLVMYSIVSYRSVSITFLDSPYRN